MFGLNAQIDGKIYISLVLWFKLILGNLFCNKTKLAAFGCEFYHMRSLRIQFLFDLILFDEQTGILCTSTLFYNCAWANDKRRYSFAGVNSKLCYLWRLHTWSKPSTRFEETNEINCSQRNVNNENTWNDQILRVVHAFPRHSASFRSVADVIKFGYT